MRLTRPPTRPLRPVIPNNACSLRITAAAGTELAGASSGGTVSRYACSTYRGSSHLTGVYNPGAFLPHAASLRQAFAHCAIFPTAASRRSPARVSVPVWLVALSRQLPVIALVGRYPTNKLIGREPIPRRWLTSRGQLSRAAFKPALYAVLAQVSLGCPPPRGRSLTCYSPVRRCTRSRRTFLARLACVRHAASVRPEPGSNSPSVLQLRASRLPNGKPPASCLALGTLALDLVAELVTFGIIHFVSSYSHGK